MLKQEEAVAFRWASMQRCENRGEGLCSRKRMAKRTSSIDLRCVSIEKEIYTEREYDQEGYVRSRGRLLVREVRRVAVETCGLRR